MTQPVIASLVGSLADAGGTRRDGRLTPAPVSPAIPARAGASGPVPQKRPSGGGVASPLVEADYANREFHAERTLVTPDGFFTVAYRPLKTLKMTDANGDEVVFSFKAPA